MECTNPTSCTVTWSKPGWKKNLREEERKRVSWWPVDTNGSKVETQEERRLFLFKWRQQLQSCTVSSSLQPPEEERLNGWVQGWDTGLYCELGFGVRTLLCSGSSFWAGGAGCCLGCSFLGKEKEGGRTRTTGHVQRPGVGTEWCHIHTHTHLKGLPTTQIASQSGSQSCSSRHLSWQTNSQSRGALGLYLV